MARPLPTADEAFAGGEAAIFNAESLLESAAISAERGNFGVAVALGILALEEAVKARALFGFLLARRTGAPFGLSDDTFRDVLFRKHALRHVLAFHQGMSNALHSALLGVLPHDEAGRQAIKRDLELARWLAEADRAKQRGLYVDHRNGKWAQPKDVRPEEWEATLTAVRPFVEETRRQHGVARAL